MLDGIQDVRLELRETAGGLIDGDRREDGLRGRRAARVEGRVRAERRGPEDGLLELGGAQGPLSTPEEAEGEAVAFLRRPGSERDGGAEQLLGLGSIPERAGEHVVRLLICRRAIQRASCETDGLGLLGGVELRLREAVAGRERRGADHEQQRVQRRR